MIVISANIIVTRLIKLCWLVACVIHNIVDKQINVNNNMPILSNPFSLLKGSKLGKNKLKWAQ